MREVIVLKEILLKSKVVFTNICRVITSFLFITITTSKGNVSLASALEEEYISCYAVGEPIEKDYTVFFILVPIVLIVLGIGSYLVYKKGKNNKKMKKDNE